MGKRRLHFLTDILFSGIWEIKKATRFLLAGLFLLVASRSAYGTHLIGGSITYKYLGIYAPTGKIMYRVTVDMFRDCDTPKTQSFSTPFDTYIGIGVYERKANSVGDTPLVSSMNIRLGSEFPVLPPSGAKNCTFAPRSCIKEGLYNDTLFVNPSNYGYYLEYTRCCRNIMLNVPDNMGQTYFAIIPPTFIINSTPTFNVVPSPYICAQDTVSLSYGTTETDGDSLAYVLDWPFTGGTVADPNPPPAAYFTGVPLVSYYPGYSPVFPMSKFGYADIDPYSGVLTLYAPGVGRYALAVDVFEYRNKTLISVTRRDVQIITVSGCPKQPPPVRVPIVDSLPGDNSTTTVYKVQAGHRLSFNIRYKASNSDVTKFSASGFFSVPNNFVNKPTFTFGLSGSYVTAYCNWQTTCNDGRASPYLFTVAVSDTGCPSKTTYEGYKVYVTKGSDHIDGDLKVCKDTSLNIYSTNSPKKGDTLEWAVTGGAYTRGPNDSSVTIDWGKSTAGTIRVISENDVGCRSDTNLVHVKITPKPLPPVINGPLITCSGIPDKYSVVGYSAISYTWKIQGGAISDSDTLNKTIEAVWTLGSGHRLTVSGVDSNNCQSDSSYILVNTKLSTIDTIFGSRQVCPNTTWTYRVKFRPSAVYYWKIDGGEQVSGGNGPVIRVRWGNKGPGSVKVHEQLPGGCPNDSVIFDVVKDYVITISPIKGDSSLCEFSKKIPYLVSGLPGYTYAWQVAGSTLVTGDGTPGIEVDWGGVGNAMVTVTETLYDSVNKQACASAPSVMNIILKPTPNPSEISGPTDLCENDSGLLRVKGSNGSGFAWTINGKPQDITQDSIYVGEKNIKNLVDTLHISVTEKTSSGCPGPIRYYKVLVHKLPVGSAITGPALVCAPKLSGAVYQVSGYHGSSFKWIVDGGNIVNGINTNRITVDWQSPGISTITVQEFNDFGCPGPIMKLNVKIDSLAIDIELVTTEEHNEKVIDIFWSKQYDEFFTGYYRIYRQTEGQAYYWLIDSVPHTQTYYVDKKVNTSGFAYRYRIEAVNSCGYPIRTTVHRSVKLMGTYDGDTLIHINWNPYEGWPVDKYSVNRSQDDDTVLSYYAFTNDTNFIIIKTLEGYRQCFRIAAKKAGVNNVVSWSNKVCVDFDPILWIPDVFTPNDDLHNNDYHVFVANYKTYEINIYNRWGEHIFHSTDPKIRWDGKFKGADCIEGVYLYMVNVGGVKSHIYRSGTVTLLR